MHGPILEGPSSGLALLKDRSEGTLAIAWIVNRIRFTRVLVREASGSAPCCGRGSKGETSIAPTSVRDRRGRGVCLMCRSARSPSAWPNTCKFLRIFVRPAIFVLGVRGDWLVGVRPPGILLCSWSFAEEPERMAILPPGEAVGDFEISPGGLSAALNRLIDHGPLGLDEGLGARTT